MSGSNNPPTMWDKAKDYAIKYGEIAVAGAQKAGLLAKLKTEIVMHDRSISARQKLFGIQLYDHIEPLSVNEGFWNAEDDLTMVIRPNLLSTQREISVLKIRKANFEEQITIENLKHSTRFPVKKTGEEVTFKENVVNAGKQVAHTSLISTYKTHLVVIDNLMKDHKQIFGKTMFAIFVHKEDFENWLPTERMIRSMYDACRRDVLDVEKEKKTKIEDLRALGGVYKENEPNNNNTEQQQASNNSSIYDTPSQNNSGTPQVFMSDTSTRSTTSSRMQMQTHHQQQEPYMDQSSSNDMNQNHNNRHQNDLFDPFSNNSQTTAVKTTFI